MAGSGPPTDPLQAAFDREERRQAAVEAGRARRVSSAAEREAKTQWFIDEVSNTVRMSLRARVRLATELVKNRIIRNISRPVTKTIVAQPSGKRWRTAVVVSNRSKPGEFPKADTTQLLKTVFSAYTEDADGGIYTGHVGTPIDYGVILELEMDRAFLTRTLRESYSDVLRILTGPIT